MNDQIHEPVYRAAIDSANAELRQLAETINRARARQETIFAASEALKQLVASPAAPAKPVYTMNTPTPQAVVAERVQATA